MTYKSFWPFFLLLSLLYSSPTDLHISENIAIPRLQMSAFVPSHCFLLSAVCLHSFFFLRLSNKCPLLYLTFWAPYWKVIFLIYNHLIYYTLLISFLWILNVILFLMLFTNFTRTHGHKDHWLGFGQDALSNNVHPTASTHPYTWCQSLTRRIVQHVLLPIFVHGTQCSLQTYPSWLSSGHALHCIGNSTQGGPILMYVFQGQTPKCCDFSPVARVLSPVV